MCSLDAAVRTIALKTSKKFGSVNGLALESYQVLMLALRVRFDVRSGLAGWHKNPANLISCMEGRFNPEQPMTRLLPERMYNTETGVWRWSGEWYDVQLPSYQSTG